MSTFVITGATGMIGCSLASLALKNGDNVIAIARNGSSRLDRIPCGATVLCADLNQLKTLKTDLCADFFVHLGWEKTSPLERDNVLAQQKNVDYTVDAVNLANRMGCKCFVGAGSQAEYGLCAKPLTPQTAENPLSEYGKSKLKAGETSRRVAGDLGMRHVWARILSVFGKGDNKTTLMSYLIDCFSNGKTAELTACDQVWDYLYAEDCALALYLLAKHGKNGKSYPLGSGQPRLLKDYVLAVKNAVNPNATINFGAKDYYPHQPMFLCADITELTNDCGFLPKFSFEQGLQCVLQGEKNGSKKD